MLYVYQTLLGDAMDYHNGRKFSTKDRDNDSSSSKFCAVKSHGAWWYGNCDYSNLNGNYLHGDTGDSKEGITWEMWKGDYYSLKSCDMKIRMNI